MFNTFLYIGAATNMIAVMGMQSSLAVQPKLAATIGRART